MLRACEIHQATVLNQVIKLCDSSITKPLTLQLVVEKAIRDLTATQSSASEVIFEAKSVAGTTSEATKVVLNTFKANVAFTIARALELKSFKTRNGQFAMRIAELSSDSSITLDELSSKTGSLVSAHKTIALQRNQSSASSRTTMDNTLARQTTAISWLSLKFWKRKRKGSCRSLRDLSEVKDQPVLANFALPVQDHLRLRHP